MVYLKRSLARIRAFQRPTAYNFSDAPPSAKDALPAEALA